MLVKSKLNENLLYAPDVFIVWHTGRGFKYAVLSVPRVQLTSNDIPTYTTETINMHVCEPAHDLPNFESKLDRLSVFSMPLIETNKIGWA